MTVAATVFRGCPVKITRRAQETILEELFKTKQNRKPEKQKYTALFRGDTVQDISCKASAPL